MAWKFSDLMRLFRAGFTSRPTARGLNGMPCAKSCGGILHSPAASVVLNSILTKNTPRVLNSSLQAETNVSCLRARFENARETCNQTMKDMKRVNTAAVLKGSVSVVRAPVMGCLTVPRGVVVGAFKLPGGARRTDESKDLFRRKVCPAPATGSGRRRVGIWYRLFTRVCNGNSRTFGRGMILDRM